MNQRYEKDTCCPDQLKIRAVEPAAHLHDHATVLSADLGVDPIIRCRWRKECKETAKLCSVFIYIILAILPACLCSCNGVENWRIDTLEEWQQAENESEGLAYGDGFATPTGDVSRYRSIVRTFQTKRSVKSIVFRQSAIWHNWEPVENIGPSNLHDAPVLLAVGPDDYWMFGIHGSAGNEDFRSEEATLLGFDIPLMTTAFPRQFNAPGGLQKGLGGYHAWQSRDMIHWVHHGPVTEAFSRWVTTAEYVDGKAYIYYDYPNDQDPHLYIDEDLTDGTPGKDMGIAFKDPSDGSDCAFIRDLQGRFHVVYEDWSPINASLYSWDSPLAGHAVSADGIGKFEILSPVIDQRTTPTGEVAEYLHPHWKEHPDWDSNVAIYNVHEPEQNAFGDWAAISVGGQYYLFGDFHSAGKSHLEMSVAWFTSPSMNEPFEFCGNIGKGHPDPDIAYANGRFYLVTQLENDYVSPGPWVEKVEARAGVDTDKDGRIDGWTDWQEVKERYDYIIGFSKQVKRIPASLDLSNLADGFGFCFEFRTENTTKNASKPILDSIVLSFDG